jgi:anti-sigma-K factor RskA
MTDPTKRDEDDVALAAEYALRLLSAEDQLILRTRVLTDPDFARLVAQWQETFGGMAHSVAPVTPLKATKTALEKRLFGEARKRSLWKLAWVWQTVSVASIAVAAYLGVTLINLPDPAPGALYVTELASENDSLRVLAVYNEATSELQVTRTNGGASTGRSLELWGIVDGENPVSIGLLPEASTGKLAIPAQLESAIDGLVLAVSDEPAGGSPTGQPTGAVLAAAEISRL